MWVETGFGGAGLVTSLGRTLRKQAVSHPLKQCRANSHILNTGMGWGAGGYKRISCLRIKQGAVKRLKISVLNLNLNCSH